MEPKNDASEMAEIKTYVFLDIDTTGSARLTEISLLFVLWSDLIGKEGKENLRVVGKLTKCFNPMNSGLTKEQPESLKSFDKDFCSTMELLINSYPKPVCFIAHDGYQHGFPLLRAEMTKLGKDFSDDILCADTEIVFGEMKIFEKIKGLPHHSNQTHEASSKRSTGTAVSYSLEDIYREFCGSNIQNYHRAEADTMALLDIITSFKFAPLRSEFHDYIQKNYKKINTITRM